MKEGRSGKSGQVLLRPAPGCERFDQRSGVLQRVTLLAAGLSLLQPVHRSAHASPYLPVLLLREQQRHLRVTQRVQVPRADGERPALVPVRGAVLLEVAGHEPALAPAVASDDDLSRWRDAGDAHPLDVLVLVTPDQQRLRADLAPRGQARGADRKSVGSGKSV